jgi:esterase/lipase
MNEERIAQALAAYVDDYEYEHKYENDEESKQAVRRLTESERKQLTSLTELSNRLQQRMHPVSPSPAFVQSLRDELVEEAEHHLSAREKRRRIAMISAAVAGSVVSIASVIGTIIVVVKWLRTRTRSRQASTA